MPRKLTLVVALCFAFGAAIGTWWLPLVTAQGATPASDCPATTPAENEAIVTRWYDDVLNGKNLDIVGDLLAEDAINHVSCQLPGGQPADMAAVEEGLREFLFDDFPDYHVTIEDMVAAGDLVAFRTVRTGTHSDELAQYAAVDTTATGQHVTRGEMGIIRIECGLIAEQWWVFAELELLQQIGAIPDTAGGAATPTA
ncbi:MAG: ester cyclase [Thermomicrobiales bacterium]